MKYLSHTNVSHTKNEIFGIIYSLTVDYFLKNLQTAKKGVVDCSIIIKQFYIRNKIHNLCK